MWPFNQIKWSLPSSGAWQSKIQIIILCILLPYPAYGEESIESIFLKGNDWLKKNNLDQAIITYTKVLKTDPSYSQAYHNRGIAWFYKGALNRALDDFQKAININPRNPETYMNRGAVFFRRESFNQAVAEYTKAMDIRPNHAEAYFLRGNARYRMGDYFWAISDYETSLQINPLYSDAFNQLGWALAVSPDARFRNGEKAVKMAKKALALDYGSRSLNTLAAAYAETDQFFEAVKTEEKAIAQLKNEDPTELMRKYKARLQSYRARQPWREKYVEPELKYLDIRNAKIKNPFGAAIYTRPETDAPIVKRINFGDRLNIIYKEGEWYIIKLSDNRIGWVHDNFFNNEEQIQSAKILWLNKQKENHPFRKEALGRVPGKTALSIRVGIGRIRQAPALDATIIDKLSKGVLVVVLQEEGDWYQIEYKDGKMGWAHKTLFSSRP